MKFWACKICVEKEKLIHSLKSEIAHLRDLTRPERVDNISYPAVDYERDVITSVKEDQSQELPPLSKEELEDVQSEAIRILTATY
jgi:hypothetical protein